MPTDSQVSYWRGLSVYSLLQEDKVRQSSFTLNLLFPPLHRFWTSQEPLCWGAWIDKRKWCSSNFAHHLVAQIVNLSSRPSVVCVFYYHSSKDLVWSTLISRNAPKKSLKVGRWGGKSQPGYDTWCWPSKGNRTNPPRKSNNRRKHLPSQGKSSPSWTPKKNSHIEPMRHM
jgi:hypothetical protein